MHFFDKLPVFYNRMPLLEHMISRRGKRAELLLKTVSALILIGVLVAFDGSAWQRNQNSLARLHCLAPLIQHPGSKSQINAECLNDAVVMAIWASANAQPELAMQGLASAEREMSTFTAILAKGVENDTVDLRLPFASPPWGLAEYYALLAFHAQAAGQAERAVTLFQRALVIRPTDWTSDFFSRYLRALSEAQQQVIIGLEQERTAPATTAPQVAVGHKLHPGWDTPISFPNQFNLLGFTLKSETAFELGLPLEMELFWQAPNGKSIKQPVTLSNLLPNGGFELPTLPAQPRRVLGWWQRTPEIQYVALEQTRIRLDGRESVVLVSQANQGVDDFKFSRLVPVIPNEFLLWSAWIQSEHGAPHIFVAWLDQNKSKLREEIPMHGNAKGKGRRYAGVLQVPSDARYMYWALVNLRSPGVVTWDDVFVIPLELPGP